MVEGIKEFLLRHATHQSLYVKFFFANQGNMRENITRKPFRQNNTLTSFQEFMAAEFPAIRLSTYLATRNSDRAFQNFSLKIMFCGKDADLKPHPYRKQIEAANDFSFATTEKLGQWRENEKGMSARGPPRSLLISALFPRCGSIFSRQRQPAH
ncbi:hypothetical protein ACTTAI_14550 [Rhodobacter capsulatus]|uniref:hypothetical protein n=1 Tax=Rhodobacter capsulatus TaxID=1061 RepID=UPI00402985E1